MIKNQASVIEHASSRNDPEFRYDILLISTSLLMIMIGLVMVASTSVTIADNFYSDPLYFFWRQLISVLIGFAAAFLIVNTPLEIWQKLSFLLLIIVVIFLMASLVPGIGREVNGSMRWIELGPINIQSSEIAKLCVIVYMAGYMIRHGQNVRTSFAGFIRPILVLTLVSGLLLLEPDYGATVVIFATALGMLLMGGVPLSRFFVWVVVAATTLVSLAVLSPYRLQRLTGFLDPWQDPFNTGFQLTQALIAFGRGDWFGVGLGSSVQKLFYLPEAHTDFVFAVYAEEFGLVGVIFVVLLYLIIIWRAFLIAQFAHQSGKLFSAYLAYGIGLVIGIQAFINIGVNMGVLPTKGLALPLLSYGNNSMVVTCMLIAMLIRVQFENQELKKKSLPVKTCRYGS